jgi:hypothetical protein
VPDRRHHRGAAVRDSPAQRLVGEREQVFDAAATAGQHDHLDLRVPVQRGERVDELRHGQRTLGGGVLDPEPHRGPARGRVGHDVVLGGRGPSGDQADAAGQERKPPLARRVEQALGRQQLAQPLDAGQQLADPDRADVVHPQAQRAAAQEERRLAVHDHPIALGHRRAAVADQPDRRRELQGHVGGRVAQDQESGAGAGPGGDLRELALHPDRSEPVHPLGDLAGHRADRPRLLERVRGAQSSVTVVIRLVSMVTNGGRLSCAVSQASSARRSGSLSLRSRARSCGIVISR